MARDHYTDPLQQCAADLGRAEMALKIAMSKLEITAKYVDVASDPIEVRREILETAAYLRATLIDLAPDLVTGAV